MPTIASAPAALIVITSGRGYAHAAASLPAARRGELTRAATLCGWGLWRWPAGATTYRLEPAGSAVTCQLCRRSAVYRRTATS